MISVQSIYEDFQKQNIENNWKDTIGALPQNKQNNTYQWIWEQWNEFAKTISPIETEEELRHIVIVTYIEFKSHWFMLNTYIQYQMFLTGVPEDETSYKASLLSQLIGFLEAFIELEDITNINQMLANPIQKELEKTPGLSQSMEEQLIDLYEEKSQLQDELGSSNPTEIIGMVKSLEEQLNELYQEKEDLQNKYGVSNSTGLINMIESLEDQLKVLYYDLENAVVVESKKITILGSKKIIIKK